MKKKQFQKKFSGNLWKSKSKTYRSREYTVITYMFFGIFMLMMLYFVYFLGFSSQNFVNSSYNSLQDLYADYVVRGDIMASDGTVLAYTSVDAEGNETRVYPYGRMYAHIVGYSVNGKSGLENIMNFNLLRSHSFFIDQIVNDLSGEKNIGDNVVTTLDTECQYVAYNQMAGNGYQGAVIVMKPETGEILAMVSLPDYDPNYVAQNWESITEDGSTVLLNRGTQGQYAPGSTFKIFTTLEYVRENPNSYDQYSFNCDSMFTFEENTIHCAGNRTHGAETLESSFANSCNSSYANIGLTLDPNSFMNSLNSMLFNTAMPIALESNTSKVNISEESTSFEIMSTAIGQGTTYVTPLHMLLVACAIDNDGVVMRPRLVDHTENENGVVVRNYHSQRYDTIMTSEEAELMQQYMAAVTSYGTATSLSGQSYTAYGKTGTAQVSDSSEQANGWFVGFASKEGYDDIAVVVIIEDCGSSSYAVPVAKKIFDAYFN